MSEDFQRQFAEMIGGEPKDQSEPTPDSEGVEHSDYDEAAFLRLLFGPKAGDAAFIRSIHGDE